MTGTAAELAVALQKLAASRWISQVDAIERTTGA
jgi:hypothetical protein